MNGWDERKVRRGQPNNKAQFRQHEHSLPEGPGLTVRTPEHERVRKSFRPHALTGNATEQDDQIRTEVLVDFHHRASATLLVALDSDIQRDHDAIDAVCQAELRVWLRPKGRFAVLRALNLVGWRRHNAGARERAAAAKEAAVDARNDQWAVADLQLREHFEADDLYSDEWVDLIDGDFSRLGKLRRRSSSRPATAWMSAIRTRPKGYEQLGRKLRAL